MKISHAMLSFCMLSCAALAASPEVYTVCDILNHLDEFGCREVRVRAKIEADVDVWLVGENCAKRIQIGPVIFHNWLALKLPDFPQIACKLNFEHDDRSYAELQRYLRPYDPKTQRIDVIIDGVIETRDPPLFLVSPRGAKVGFGHEGAAPAALILKRLVRIEASPHKKR